MSPDFDFRRLSDEDLEKICEADEAGAGYLPFQKASFLRVMRASDTPAIQKMASEREGLVINLDQSVIDNLNRILNEQ